MTKDLLMIVIIKCYQKGYNSYHSQEKPFFDPVRIVAWITQTFFQLEKVCHKTSKTSIRLRVRHLKIMFFASYN